MLDIEVAYALPTQQWLIALRVAPGTTVAEAIALSGLLQHCPALDIQQHAVGIASRVVTLVTPITTPCRVEVYRPLQIDPKTRRRLLGQRRKPTQAVSR